MNEVSSIFETLMILINTNYSTWEDKRPLERINTAVGLTLYETFLLHLVSSRVPTPRAVHHYMGTLPPTKLICSTLDGAPQKTLA